MLRRPMSVRVLQRPRSSSLTTTEAALRQLLSKLQHALGAVLELSIVFSSGALDRVQFRMRSGKLITDLITLEDFRGRELLTRRRDSASEPTWSTRNGSPVIVN